MSLYSTDLYKKDSKGKIRTVIVSSMDDIVTQMSGIFGGKLVTTSSVRKGKNIGKTNETSPEEQAILEAKAIVVKKLKEGYFHTIEEAEANTLVLPMLAYKIEDYLDEVDWETAYEQPKLDGIRCFSTKNIKISRKNTPIDTVDHISTGTTDFTIDGELYAHGYTFQENLSFTKKIRPETAKIKFHVYDLVSEGDFASRNFKLASLFNGMTNVEFVRTRRVHSFEQFLEYHQENIENGYEGSMLRWGKEGYLSNKRTKFLLKMKDFLDEVYEIIDVVPSNKNPLLGVIHCKMPDGQTFGCNAKFSNEEKAEFLLNKNEYIGKMAEIRFFEFTDGGLPRFPVFYGVRNDK